MIKKSVKKVVIDDIYRLYIYKSKSVLKKKKNGKWTPVFVGKNPSDLLDSSILDNKLKEKIKEKLNRVS